MVWHNNIKSSKKCVCLRGRKVAGAEKYNKVSDWSWKILVWLFLSKYVSESVAFKPFSIIKCMKRQFWRNSVPVNRYIYYLFLSFWNIYTYMYIYIYIHTYIYIYIYKPAICLTVLHGESSEYFSSL